MKKRVLSFCYLILLSAGLAQPELMQWGNLRGLRDAGHLHAFETSLQVLRADGAVAARTAHYAHKSAYTRAGEAQRVVVGLGGVEVTEEVVATGPRSARVTFTLAASDPGPGGAACFVVDLPWADFGAGRVGGLAVAELGSGRTLTTAALRAEGAGRALEVRTDAAGPVQLAVETENGVQVLRLRFPLLAGPFPAGAAATRTFQLAVEGDRTAGPCTWRSMQRAPGVPLRASAEISVCSSRRATRRSSTTTWPSCA